MTSTPEHRAIKPSILYYGTPVSLISTMNPDGTPNLSPMSSSWALGNRIVLGMATNGCGFLNIERTMECVINMPSPEIWERVERIAATTGVSPVPDYKVAMGYRFEPRKFECAGLTPIMSETVAPPRVAECPLQFEARVLAIHHATPVEGDGPVPVAMIETRVERVHAHESIVIPGSNHIDTSRWSPLFYVFRHYFGLGNELGTNYRVEA